MSISIDHLGIKVRSFEKSRKFYAAALAPLGFEEQADAKAKSASYGGLLALSEGKGGGAFHFAFKAAKRSVVDAFHAAALKAGGEDNGKPGLRADYSPTYYAAFVLDPDGNNVEVVCHEAK